MYCIDVCGNTIPRSVAQENNIGFSPAVYVLAFRIYDAPTATDECRGTAVVISRQKLRSSLDQY